MARAIEPEQLGQLYDTHAGALKLFARQWCDAAGAEDVVQEAFIALAGQAQMPRQVVAWLHGVVRNRSISWSRKQRRRESHEERAARTRGPFLVVDAGLSPHEAAGLLEALDSESRQAVVARIWGGLNFDEIAELLQCSLTTAHRRYHDGLAQLSERLNRTDEPCHPTTAHPTTNRT